MKARWKIVLVLIALVLVSGYAGGLIGARIQRQKYWRRIHPEAWNVHAMRTLEGRLHLEPAQKDKVQAVLDSGVVELQQVRGETITKTNAILDRLIAEVERDLSPEQRAEFEKLKSERKETNLDMLNVEPPRAAATPVPR
jgi:hypothetical protein